VHGSASVLRDPNEMISFRAGLVIALALCVVLPVSVSAKQPRSSSVKREFQLTHPCPANGRTSGACPGYIKDHIRALKCGGPDAVSNMQWQTTADAKAKNKWETKGCGR
jgi:hypothetical protein